MTNPIHVLLDHFFPALEKIAPEKAAELQTIMAKHPLKFEMADTEESFFFFVSPVEKKITAGVGSLGRLWATAYGYLCLYTVVSEVARKDFHTVHEIDLKNDKRIADASTLLEWTIHIEKEIADLRSRINPFLRRSTGRPTFRSRKRIRLVQVINMWRTSCFFVLVPISCITNLPTSDWGTRLRGTQTE